MPPVGFHRPFSHSARFAPVRALPRAGALLYVADGQKIQNAKSAIRCSVLAGARRAKLAARQDKPFPNNPRSHPKSQIEVLASLMKRWGVDQPIVVDEQGVVIKGHGRLLAAHKAGFEEFPVVQHFGLAEEDKTAIRLADNQSSLLSEWNQEFLSEQLAELQLAGFDMALLGFDASALPGFTGDLGETVSLSDRFGIVPFSIFNAREGIWHDRKRAWLALGIQSEVGRGENLIGRSPQDLFCHLTGIHYGKARKIVTEAMEKEGENFDLAALVKKHGGRMKKGADFSGVDMSPTIKRLKPRADQAHVRKLRARRKASQWQVRRGCLVKT